jgi:hypothetical protein
MLKIIDNGEFYEQEKPLSLKDLKSLVLILKQVYNNTVLLPLWYHKPFSCCVEHSFLSIIAVVSYCGPLMLSVIGYNSPFVMEALLLVGVSLAAPCFQACYSP